MTSEQKYKNCLNQWLESWFIENPFNAGINWTCAQEASIRTINVLNCWNIIDGNFNNLPSRYPNRIEFIKKSVIRIYKTRFYAKAQENNHWLSESAALFIAANYLLYSSSKKNYFFKLILRIARSNLEKCVNKLIMNDGSFSQYSTNYHRLVIDTLIQVENWRINFQQKNSQVLIIYPSQKLFFG